MIERVPLRNGAARVAAGCDASEEIDDVRAEAVLRIEARVVHPLELPRCETGGRRRHRLRRRTDLLRAELVHPRAQRGHPGPIVLVVRNENPRTVAPDDPIRGVECTGQIVDREPAARGERERLRRSHAGHARLDGRRALVRQRNRRGAERLQHVRIAVQRHAGDDDRADVLVTRVAERVQRIAAARPIRTADDDQVREVAGPHAAERQSQEIGGHGRDRSKARQVHVALPAARFQEIGGELRLFPDGLRSARRPVGAEHDRDAGVEQRQHVRRVLIEEQVRHR